MRPLQARNLWILGTVGAAGSWLLAELASRRGASPLPIPWSTIAIAVVASVGVLWLAWGVKQVREGKRGRIDPVRAVRTAVFAQACAYAGVLLGSTYGAYALVLARDWGHLPRREAAIAAGVAAIGGAVMTVAGIVAEGWCRIRPGDGDGEAAEGSAEGGTLAV